MNQEEITKVLEDFLNESNKRGREEKKETVHGTYQVQSKALSESNNRLNSGTLRNQILVFPDEKVWNDSSVSAKSQIYANQRVFVQKTNGKWDVFIGMSEEQPNKIIEDADDFEKILKSQLPILGIYPSKNTNLPLQQIFYGAPGTGKSHRIKNNDNVKKADEKNLVFRTTFHPDSDYSTFVGCYKPTMINKEPLYKVGELIHKLSEIKTSGVTYPCHKFAAKYWESLKGLSSSDINSILAACGFTSSMNVEISKGIAIGEDFSKKSDDKKIVYSFVPQSFTKAYLRAWQINEPVYLVIEEINRGNCAQIFGDLFQLLDRKDGVSEYPIKADNDLAVYIAEKLSGSLRTDIPKLVKSGEELMLPSNLYIWATMNTSDQSLFPIDSAFKRRWDWKYIKIKDEHKDWKIDIDIKTKGADGTETTEKINWWKFVQKINEIIASMTSSADKQLGYFFCKACKKKNDSDTEATIITKETFVSKVIFYLWNDVFKDYGFEDASLFQFKETIDGKEEIKGLTFPDFYDESGENVNESRLKEFIGNVMNWKSDKEVQQ